MVRSRRFLMVSLAAVCAAVAAPGAADAALTATVTPSPSAITATPAGAVQLRGAPSGTVYSCGTGGFNATLRSAAGGAPLAIANNVNWSFLACTVGAGRVAFNMACGATENFTVDGLTVGNVTPGAIGLDCTATIPNPRCTVQFVGAVPHEYNNVMSRVTVGTTGQTLVARGSTCAAMPNDASVTLSDPVGGNLVFAAAPLTTIVVV